MRRARTTPSPLPAADAAFAQDLALAWRGAKRYAAAFVVAAFPGLFVLDRLASWPLSPVLPGLLALAAVLAFLPFLLMEVALRRARRRPPPRRHAAADRLARHGRWALAAAAAWFAAWFVWGVP